ncbi:MAG: hypothetical protein ABSF22_23195 [Bryobacteraceae bacterium]|jgi:patatin-related protein
MNGITQELLRAVRAAAPRLAQAPGDNPRPGFQESLNATELLISDPQLQSTEAVYRTIGRTLFHGRTAGTGPSTTGPVRTRIVVDLLAGTSAGGINAVYLAKAVVNNQKLDDLKQMWMDQADIDRLLNDGASEPSAYAPGPHTTSLLNSTRMYGLLYRAFQNMDKVQAEGNALTDELDLFVTTTELNGVVTLIQLSDRAIQEQVHKAAFHFVYGKGRYGSPNDFTSPYNPMLAFARRAAPRAFRSLSSQ